MKKTLYTLNVENYSPEITALSYPLLAHYAEKIDADFRIISERKFPGFPVVYEKLQIHELGKDNDWNLYIDSDALVHPDLFDVTDHIDSGTVLHFALDLAGCRWKSDRFFKRDGRHIGSCNWLTVASGWCIDLWEPLTDLSLEQAIQNITPVVKESRWVTNEHLIDDYVLSRNIAKYGLKVETFQNILLKLNRSTESYFWHQHILNTEQKVNQMHDVLAAWGVA